MRRKAKISKRSKRIRKKSRSVRRIGRRSAIRKTRGSVVGRTSVRGVMERVSTRTEIKYIDYYYEPSSAGESISSSSIATTSLIWTSDSQKLNISGIQFNPNPQASVSFQGGISGTQWQYCGVDLRFIVNTRNSSLSSTHNNNILRLLVLQNRDAFAGMVPSSANMPVNFTDVVNTKVWKVMMDKTFPWSTGYMGWTVTNNAPTTPNTSGGSFTPSTPMKEFRFKIPFRCLARYPTGAFNAAPAAQWCNDHNIYVFLFARFTCPDILYNCVMARIYFKDT